MPFWLGTSRIHVVGVFISIIRTAGAISALKSQACAQARPCTFCARLKECSERVAGGTPNGADSSRGDNIRNQWTYEHPIASELIQFSKFQLTGRRQNRGQDTNYGGTRRLSGARKTEIMAKKEERWE
jgi:hypothetical protein